MLPGLLAGIIYNTDNYLGEPLISFIKVGEPLISFIKVKQSSCMSRKSKRERTENLFSGLIS